MKKNLTIFVIAALALVGGLLSASCQRDPIVYPTGDYYVSIKVNAKTSDGSEPQIFAVNFYDTLTHRLINRFFIRPEAHPAGMPAGGYVSGVEAGVYDILVYNYDTKIASVRNTDFLSQSYSQSETASWHNGIPIIYAPDHLYSYCERVSIPFVTEDDGVYVINTVLDPLVEDWTVIVEGVKNLDIATGISFLLSGQTFGRTMQDAAKMQDRVLVLFQGVIAQRSPVETKSGENLYIRTPYTTFGKLESDQRCLMTMTIMGPNGSQYVAQYDVTDQILDQQDKDHIIYLNSDIVVEPRQDGGFDPQVQPWDPENHTYILE